MDKVRDRDALPTTAQLRQTLGEQAPLVADTALSDVVRVRVQRALSTTGDVIALDAGEPVREAAARAIAWLAESVGAYVRLPPGFAQGHTVPGRHAPLLELVDGLDLLGLTLDRVYDAACRHDDGVLQAELVVLRERFGSHTEPGALVPQTPITPDHLDRRRVEMHGLEVGRDGIPRLPVPEQPVPRQPPTPAGGEPDQEAS